MEKEAKARIKINKLLEEAGWRFFDTDKDKATIKLESSISASINIRTERNRSSHRRRNAIGKC